MKNRALKYTLILFLIGIIITALMAFLVWTPTSVQQRNAPFLALGAQVKKEDLPVLVAYLTEQHGPLPDGAGKKIMLEVCTMCHELHRIRDTGATREEWDDILVHMINEGAPLTDDDFPILLNYLARNFRPR